MEEYGFEFKFQKFPTKRAPAAHVCGFSVLVVVISQVTGILRMRIDIEYYLLSSGGSFTLLPPSLNLIVIYLLQIV